MTKDKVIFIVGPTSSGKTQVSLDLAEKLNAEIISCDSMQIYKNMDVLTSALRAEHTKKIPHYLIRELDPSCEYSAAIFADKAQEIIPDIISRGKTPLIVGGTGLYMKSLLDGLFESPSKDEYLRAELTKEAEEKGTAHLFDRLKKVDPATCEKISPNDLKRIIRALEVYELTGDTIHEMKKTSFGIAEKYDCRIFALEFPRDILYARINDTVDRMFDGGIVDEVKGLRERELSLTAGKALGIKEIFDLLDGKRSVDQTKEELKKNTRRYAKRQLTWLRGDERVEWVDGGRETEEVVNDVLERLGNN